MPDEKPFRVGDFEVDPGLNTVHGPEGVRQIEPKAMQVLCVLYRRAGETVSREDLLQEVWAGRIVVEETLTRTISQLRQAFGDGKREPRYIQTIPKRGYRLIAATDPAASPPPATEPRPEDAATPEEAPPKPPMPESSGDATRAAPPTRWRRYVAAIVILALVGLTWLMLPSVPDDAREDSAGNATPSVAVLPFEHLGSEPEGAYLADGVAEELLNALASVPGLRVPSRHSSFAFRDQGSSLDEISEALDVRHILEGSVRRSGDDLRISARLVDVETDTTLWSRQFDGEIGRIFEVEEEIANSVLDALEGTLPSLAAAPPSRFTRSENVDAYSLYLQGNYWWMNGTTSNWFYQARDAFEEAIALDPKFAEAHGSLAYIYARHDFHDQYMPSDEANARAEQAIERALALDDRVTDAYHARAILATSRGDYAAAEGALERALAIEPRSAVAHYLYSELHLARNEPDLALAAAERALAIDPLSPWVNVNKAIVLYHRGDLDRAAGVIDDAIRIDPEYTWAFLWQAVIRHSQGRLADAVGSMKRCLELDPASETNAAYLGMLYLELMDEDSARQRFEQAASLHGDSNAARFWARFISLVVDREDDDILLALTGDALAGLHNERYSLIPVIADAAKEKGAAGSFEGALLREAPALAAATPNVRPRHADIALALAAIKQSSDPATSQQLTDAVRVSADAFPELFANLGLDARWHLVRGDKEAAVTSLEHTLNDGWIRDWWLIRQSAIFDPVRETPAFKRIDEQVNAHAARQAALIVR